MVGPTQLIVTTTGLNDKWQRESAISASELPSKNYVNALGCSLACSLSFLLTDLACVA